MIKAIVSVVVGTLIVAGCATVSSPAVPAKTADTAASPPRIGAFKFSTGMNVNPGHPSWYLHGYHCVFADRKASAQIPPGVYGIAGDRLTFWARTKLSDTTTTCVFSPDVSGFSLFVFSNKTPKDMELEMLLEQIRAILDDAMNEYLEDQKERSRDLPNKTPGGNALARR